MVSDTNMDNGRVGPKKRNGSLAKFSKWRSQTMGTEPKLYEHERLYKARRDAADELYEALVKARDVIAEERDNMVECATTPPVHDLATLDPMTKPYVDEYDAALAQIDAALAKSRGEHNGH